VRDRRSSENLAWSEDGASGATEIVVPPRLAVREVVVESTDPDGRWSHDYRPDLGRVFIQVDPEQGQHEVRVRVLR